jgi:hypothetical protein
MGCAAGLAVLAVTLDDGGDLLGHDAVEIRAYGGVLQSGAGQPVGVVPAGL